MLRTTLIALLILLLSGCCCIPCHSQEAVEVTEVEKLGGTEPLAARDTVLTATYINTWKQDCYDCLNKVTDNPWDFMLNTLLVNGFGLAKIPSGTDTVTVTPATLEKMVAINKRLKATVGFILVSKIDAIQMDSSAISEAIKSATTSITDVTLRKKFLEKAQALQSMTTPKAEAVK